MKSRKSIIVFCSCVLFLIACQYSDLNKAGNVNDLSPFAKKFIGLNTTASTALSASGNGLINQSFQNGMNGYKNLSSDSTVTTPGDTTIIGNPGGDCSSYLQITNPDSSVTVVMDYGEGCTQISGDCEYKLFGKNSYTYKYTYTKTGSVYHSLYFYSSSSKNFGGKYFCSNDSSYWVSNGNSTSTGESTYDTLKQTFLGYYTYKDSSDYLYNSTHYFYASVGKTSYSNQESIIESQNYQYKNGDDYYQSTVTAPIVRNYACSNYNNRVNGVTSFCFIPIPISGHEIVKYKQDGVSGTFEIDYGNGTCDSLITIIENGKVIVIDLNRLPVGFGG